jgi:hypothetical protein
MRRILIVSSRSEPVPALASMDRTSFEQAWPTPRRRSRRAARRSPMIAIDIPIWLAVGVAVAVAGGAAMFLYKSQKR